MQGLITVIKFTIKDMAQRKSFIISNIIILGLIILMFNIPNILKKVMGDSENSKQIIQIIDVDNVFEGTLENLKNMNLSYDIKISSKNLEFDKIKEEIQNGEIDNAIIIEKKDEKINIQYIVKNLAMNSEMPQDLENAISSLYSGLQISKLGLTQEQLRSIQPDFNFEVKQAETQEVKGNIYMAVYETDDIIERVILVGVAFDTDDDTERSLDELGELAKTAGAQTVGRMIQTRDNFHPATYIGKGKIEELRLMIDELDATGIICDDELSPAQFKNLEDELGIKVMDRTMVILDIFAARATSSEGKIQVEMAQLKYRSIRLAGFGTSMSRLGGGIGTRGPGEKKIETDRRLIRDRISKLSADLKDMKEHRDVQRSKRAKTSTPVAAIVGYTNAGKSTLLNKLTDAGVLSENKLFATLDPTTRSMELPNGEKVLLTDTVGFIRKLPHNLIEAFKSTLEEAKYADIIVHVVDVSNPDYEQQMSTVYATLKQLGVEGKPVITLFNKCDVLPEKPAAKDLHADYTYNISAIRGNGLEAFKECIQEIILKSRIRIERVFPYSEAGKIQLIRQFGQLESEEYTEDGIKVLAYVPKEIEGKL